jgi:hypothetical protein
MAPTLEQIARDVLFVETLQIRNQDRLDFHDVAVWQIREALERAYAEGLDAGRRVAARS